MRTRRSETGPGLGSQNDESENEIRHSPLKKRLDCSCFDLWIFIDYLEYGKIWDKFYHEDE